MDECCPCSTIPDEENALAIKCNEDMLIAFNY